MMLAWCIAATVMAMFLCVLLVRAHQARLKAAAIAFKVEHLAQPARQRILQAIEDQHQYEREHGLRQQARMQELGGMEGSRTALHHGRHKVTRRHGAYDADQRALSVELRVARWYFENHATAPDNLRQLVEEALR